MNRRNKLLRSLIFPVTPLVVVTGLSTVSTIWAFIIVFTGGPTTALIGAIAAGINLVVILLYIFDRVLIKKIAYKTIVGVELILGILIGFFFYYSESTTEIKIETDKNYVIILFDSKENPLSDFEKNGLFGKKLLVDNHIIHVDSSLYNNEDLRIYTPEEWGGFSHQEGFIQLNGKPVKYIVLTKDKHIVAIDSLLYGIDQK